MTVTYQTIINESSSGIYAGGDTGVTSVSYFTNDAYKDAFMVFDKDTLYCQMHHFERTYKLNPGVVVSFIFDNYKNQSTPGYFVFNDQIFGNGPVRINFDKEYMSKIPKLKNI